MSRAKIFISYRWDETGLSARYLYERLAAHFGKGALFFDVYSIEHGEDFQAVIDGILLDQSVIMLAVIGDRYLSFFNPDGQPRPERPIDHVRIEVASGLRGGNRVIPVLMNGASMPSAESLPEDMRPLTRKNSVKITHVGADSEISILIRSLESMGIVPLHKKRVQRRRWALAAAAILVLAVVILGLSGFVPWVTQWSLPVAETRPPAVVASPATIVTGERPAEPPLEANESTLPEAATEAANAAPSGAAQAVTVTKPAPDPARPSTVSADEPQVAATPEVSSPTPPATEVGAQLTVAVPLGMTDCDRLAGSPLSPRADLASSLASGTLPWVIRDADAAVAACREALALHPGEPMFALYLARALRNSDTSNPEIVSLVASARATDLPYAHLAHGINLLHGFGGTAPNVREARAVLAPLCTTSQSTGCHEFAITYLQPPEGEAAQPLVAVAHLERGCEAGNLYACNDLARWRSDGRPDVPDDLVEALRLYALVCEGGAGSYSSACAGQGRLLVYGGEGITTDPTLGLSLLEGACRDGNGWSCLHAGEVHRFGHAGDVNFAEALVWYERGCGLNDAAACGGRGYVLVYGGEGITTDPALGLSLLEGACGDANGWSCGQVGYVYKDGVLGEVNRAAALSWFERGCILGYAEACGWRGYLLVYGGERITADPDLGLSLLEGACADGHAGSCYSLGAVYNDGVLGEVNLAAALNSFERGCELGDRRACAGQGRLLFYGGEGITTDPTLGLSLMEGACRDGDGWSCDQAGAVHRDGRAEGTTLVAALGWFERGCEIGYVNSCGNRGRLLVLRLNGITADPTLGMTLLENACNDEHPHWCNWTGIFHQNGRAGEVDLVAALNWFERGCEAGYAEACGRQGRLLVNGGEGITTDPALGLSLLGGACEDGNGWSCNEAGNVHRNGFAGDVNLSEALQWYERGCTLNEDAACGNRDYLLAHSGD